MLSCGSMFIENQDELKLNFFFINSLFITKFIMRRLIKFAFYSIRRLEVFLRRSAHDIIQALWNGFNKRL